MRFFEWGLLIISLFLIIYNFFNKKNNTKNKVIILIVFLSFYICHIFFESIRWQMFSIYLLDIFIILNVFFQIKKKWKKITFLIINLLIIILTAILLIIFPINKIPIPDGDYRVGTMTFDLVDQNRKEIYGNDTDALRKIRVQMWYPTDDTSGKLDNWISDGKFVCQQIATFVNLPPFFSEYISVIKSNSFINANLASNVNNLPVVIISHGWTSFRSLHTDFAEMLASHGYLVLAIDHTYGAMGTVFEDGTEVKVDLNALASSDDQQLFLKSANKLVDTFYLDSKLVVDYIPTINQGQDQFSIFKGKIAIDNIGLLGHSTGGGGLVKLAINDSNIKAIFGLDPWVEPIDEKIISQGLKIPAVFLRSEQWATGPNNVNLKILEENSNNNLNIYQIDGSIHQDFSMLYMFNPIDKYLGFSGQVNSDLNREIQRTYLIQFFDKYLKGENTNIDKLDDSYDIVEKVNFN